MKSVFITRRALNLAVALAVSVALIEAQTTENSLKTPVLNASSSVSPPKATNTRPTENFAGNKITIYERLVRERPEDAVLHNNLGARYALAKRLREAATALERAVELDPKMAQARLNLAIVYKELGRHNDALVAVQKILSLSPANSRAKNVLCDLYTTTGLNNEAIDCYETLQKTMGLDKISVSNYGYALLEAGKAGRAFEVLAGAVTEFPNDISLLNGLGIAQFKKKKYELCIATFKRAMEMDPTRAEVRFNLAVAQLAARDRAAVLRHYNFLKDSDPDLARKVYRMLYSDKLIFVNAPK